VTDAAAVFLPGGSRPFYIGRKGECFMKKGEDLRRELRAVDRRSYPAYKGLAGAYDFGSFLLVIDHVQGDPFASPSSVHIEVKREDAGFPSRFCEKGCAGTALEDFLIRRINVQFDYFNFKAKGSGKSGMISITRCGQEVLKRSACEITDHKILVRFSVGFPAFGRTICAGELEKILFDFLPRCVENSLFYKRLDPKQVEAAVFLAEDQAALREHLREEGLVAFVADGSVLPRKSGVSDLPMAGSVPFVSPDSMARTFRLPHRGEIRGMAIEKGVTLIVGGGYHGKSTLLEALQNGVYDHIAGDGREFVLTDETAVKLRAEDGRSIRNVDISLFINDLPNKKDTHAFSTPDASGSTSQAAAVIEGMEAGSGLFLIDEDTSATNFMVRDEFMQEVICREKEPITPFLERVRDLYEKAGVSTILVAGSSGAFFYVADRILQMDAYRPVDITVQVKILCDSHVKPRIQAPDFSVPGFVREFPRREREERRGRGGRFGGERAGKRGPAGETGDKERTERRKIRTSGTDSFSLDRETVDMRYVEQLTDNEVTNGLAYLIRFCLEQADGKKTVSRLAEEAFALWEKKGWEAFCGSYVPCGLARPRKQELFAALNRYRGSVSG